MNDLKETLKIFAEEYLTDGEHFLIDIERSTKNSRKYAVIIDGDNGVSIDFCSKLSRHISVQIDEEIGEDDIDAQDPQDPAPVTAHVRISPCRCVCGQTSPAA